MAITKSNRQNPPIRNVIGLEIRRLREAKGWSQADFARRLQLAGWDIDRTVLTKIELRRRCLNDYEMLLIGKVLGATLNEFVPIRLKLNGFF